VCSEGEADKATRLLINSQQKFVMDFPAEFIDPPFENALTYHLSKTWVTPNMVTFAGALVAAVVAWLFWHGYFLAGAFLIFPVEVLDGVDGKLARTKLEFSKLGRHEDVIDFFCENSWYVSLGVGLSTIWPGSLPAVLAGLLIFSDTADNLFYTFSGKWHGTSIDLFSPFDGRFRRFAGRRNIYGFMFITGFLLGYPLQTFALVACWAAITAAIHGVRLMQYGRSRKKILQDMAMN
jgi:phosphatidylglycerophosphate synthase